MVATVQCINKSSRMMLETCRVSVLKGVISERKQEVTRNRLNVGIQASRMDGQAKTDVKGFNPITRQVLLQVPTGRWAPDDKRVKSELRPRSPNKAPAL